jgi:hypothetical protein
MSLLTRDEACPGCGYNLRGLEEQHRCPECGHRYDLRPRVIADAPQLGRMNAIEKLCAMLALLLGAALMVAGAFGTFFGIRMSFALPPLLGIVPLFFGWGIYRMFRISWQADRIARRAQTRPKPIPSIYRDPIPNAHIDVLDRELSEQIRPTAEETPADAYPH